MTCKLLGPPGIGGRPAVPGHAVRPLNRLRSSHLVTGDSNARQAAEFLCSVADAAALPKSPRSRDHFPFAFRCSLADADSRIASSRSVGVAVQASDGVASLSVVGASRQYKNPYHSI